MKNQRPNILFILIDDLGWMDLSCYGSKFYETPNIDSLSIDGISFSNAYASCPVCSPTRASIMSGKYPARVGVTNFIGGHARGRLIDAPYIDHLPLSEKSVASALKDGGYNTWHVGKWHLGKSEFYPQHHGFEVNIGGCHLGHPINGYFSPWNVEHLDDVEEGQYLTDRLTDEAINLIKNNDGNPFFLNLCHYTVHTPIQAKEEHIEKFKKKAETMGIDKQETFEEGEYFPCEHKKDMRVKRRLIQSSPEYAAMIYSLDEGIGRIVQVLKETGQYDNTIIIFTSDNGGLSTAEGSPTCNTPLSEGKGWMYDGGVRVPLIIKWIDNLRACSWCEIPVISPDFYPTFLETAGLPLIPEQHVDGVSLMPLIKGEGNFNRDAIFWHYPHYGNQGGTPGAAVRMGDWKLIKFFEYNRYELYNLKEDIKESKNIAVIYPEKTETMKTILENWLISIEAKIPVENLEWKPC